MQAHLRSSLLLAAALLTSGCALITALGEDPEDQDGADMAVTPDMSGTPDMVVTPDMPSLETLYPRLDACKSACEQPGSSTLCISDSGQYRCETPEGIHDRCVRSANLLATGTPPSGTVHATLSPAGIAILAQSPTQLEGISFTSSAEPERLTVPSVDRVRMLGVDNIGALALITESNASAGSAYKLITIKRPSGAGGIPGVEEEPLRISMGGVARGVARCDSAGQHIFAAPYDGPNRLRLAALLCDKADAVDRWYVGGFIGADRVFTSNYLSMPSEMPQVGAAFRMSTEGVTGVATVTRTGQSYALRVYQFNPNQPDTMPPVIELASNSMMPRVLALPPGGADPAGCPLDRMVNDQPPTTWFDYRSSPPRLFVASAGPGGYAVSAPPIGSDRLTSQACFEGEDRHILRDGTFSPNARASALLLERGAPGAEELVVALINDQGALSSPILRPVPGKYSELRAHAVRADQSRTVIVGTRRAEGSTPIQQAFIMALNAEGRPLCN